MLAFTGKGDPKGVSSVDPSRLGGHATRTTEYTSNIGHNTTHEGGAGAAISLNAPPPGSATPTVYPGGVTDNVSQRTAGNTGQILNYPYAFDQD